MKLYRKEPDEIIRINIKRQGDKNEYISVHKTSIEQAKAYIEDTIKSINLSPFTKGRTTNIEFREAKGGKNGKSVSISFKGMSPAQAKDAILSRIHSDSKAAITEAGLSNKEKEIGLSLIEFYETMKGFEKISNGQEREGKKATKLIMTINDIKEIIKQ